MRDLFIYHPGSGTAIALSDEVYLIDASRLSAVRERLTTGSLSAASAYGIGYRLDNYNMTNLFFGE
jgi:hypothetical protein